MTITESLKVIDTDTHVAEPPDLWTSRLSEKWGDRRPHVRFHEGWGTHRWLVDGKWLNPVALYNVSGWHEYPPSYPDTFEKSDPAGHDPHHRLSWMDQYGIYAQVLYPNVIGFDSHAFFRMDDAELALACVRAYNDFLTDFASANPDRLLPIAMMPFWDVDACVEEMHRCREHGHRGILWGAKLHALGFPRITTGHWDRVYAAAQDLELSVNLHVGLGAYDEQDMTFNETNRTQFRVSAYVADSATMFAGNMHTIASLLVSDLFERFPRLQMVSVESGFGYLPYLLEALDWQWKNAGGPVRHPDRRLPSEKFFTNLYGTFWFEQKTLQLLEAFPEFADRLMFETDFPHPTSLTPGPASAAEPPNQQIEWSFQGISSEIARKVLHSNAARLYGVGNE